MHQKDNDIQNETKHYFHKIERRAIPILGRASAIQDITF